MQERILAYLFSEEQFAVLTQTLAPLGFDVRRETETGRTLGSAAGLGPETRKNGFAPGPAAPMLVLAGLSEERLDLLLAALRQAGLRIPFKAVLTETNRDWLPGELFAHLAAERAAMRQWTEKTCQRPENMSE